jgi:uncharacterized ferritin-like protein (DUF455 family)
MKSLFDYACDCLQAVDIEQKLATTHAAWQAMQNGTLTWAADEPLAPMSATRFPSRPLLLPPRQMPKRRLNAERGVATLFHALAHIEFVAIYLAWDMVYRFRGLPAQFYRDWLKVADEEAQHFDLIRNHLRELGMDYGDLPAHQGLWEHAQDTEHDVLARLAIVPRCMEARGLDVTPVMIEKFQARNDPASVAILTRILQDEIGHVAIGSHWFKRLCQQQSLDFEQKYRELLQQFYPGKPKGPFNQEMRIMAGFSIAELTWLETL